MVEDRVGWRHHCARSWRRRFRLSLFHVSDYLTVAAGLADGYAAQIMSSIAGRLTATSSPVRLRVVSVDLAFDAAKSFSSGKADLAIVRADVGDLSEARTVVLAGHGVVLIIVPPGSSIDSIDALKGVTVGVVGGAPNHAVVEAIKQEYDLASKKIVFKDLAVADVSKALQSKQVSAFFRRTSDPKISVNRTHRGPGKRQGQTSLIAIEDAGAIAEVGGAYETYDLPKGTLWGSPPVPDDDLTTLRVPFYLVASKKLNDDVVANLTRAIMNAAESLSVNTLCSRKWVHGARTRMPTFQYIPVLRRTMAILSKAFSINTVMSSTTGPWH